MNNAIFLFIFFTIWFAPIIAGVAIAKKKNRSPNWFWLGIWPGAGFWVFIVMLCLKPLMICENCGKKMPAGSKVCPYCTKETSIANETDEETKTRKRKENKRVLITVFTVIVIIAILISFVFVSLTASFKNSDPYKYSVELIEDNSEVQEYLGENYKQKGMITGSIQTNGNGTGQATMGYKLKGQNGISRVYVYAVRQNDIWYCQQVVFYKEIHSADAIVLLNNK